MKRIKSTGTYYDFNEKKEKPYTGGVVKVELDSDELWECLRESVDLPIDFREKCPNLNRVICKCIEAARDQAKESEE